MIIAHHFGLKAERSHREGGRDHVKSLSGSTDKKPFLRGSLTHMDWQLDWQLAISKEPFEAAQPTFSIVTSLGGVQREAKGDDEDEDGLDPEMAAAMGFAGFSGGR